MDGIPEPLWGHWYLGEQLYESADTVVCALTRRDGGGRPCVVKRILLEAGDEAGLERVRQECRNQERMAESGYAADILDDLTLELPAAEGRPERIAVLLRQERMDCLAELMREGEQFSPAEVRRIGQDLCQALIYGQKLDILHRDIKPANIYRSAGGRYKLSDFGISCPADSPQPGGVAGTVAYMAPETARGESAGAGGDVYSLGLVLYQLLNRNQLPFTSENSTYDEVQNAIAARIRGEALPPLRCPDRALEKAVRRACAADPRRRWQSGEEFLNALREGGRSPLPRRILPLLLALAIGVGAGWSIAAHSGSRPTGEEADEPLAAVERVIVDGEDDTAAVTHRYEVIRQALTWDDARIWCESRGGHLATVTQAGEARSLQRLADQAELEAVWLGANNRNTSMGFQWLTGEDFTYAEWGPGEPNNSNGEEYYLMLQKRNDEGWVWNDSRLDGMSLFDADAAGFICEWEEDFR